MKLKKIKEFFPGQLMFTQSICLFIINNDYVIQQNGKIRSYHYE